MKLSVGGVFLRLGGSAEIWRSTPSLRFLKI